MFINPTSTVASHCFDKQHITYLCRVIGGREGVGGVEGEVGEE